MTGSSSINGTGIGLARRSRGRVLRLSTLCLIAAGTAAQAANVTVNLSVSVLVPALCIVPDGPTLARLGDLAGATLLADSCRASAPYGLRLEGSDSAIPAPPPASDAAMIVTVAY